MSQAVGTKATPPLAPVDGVWLDGTRRHVRNHPWRTYGTVADMVAPAPSGLWVFLDEDEHLISALGRRLSQYSVRLLHILVVSSTKCLCATVAQASLCLLRLAGL